jgi:hypothetical protein
MNGAAARHDAAKMQAELPDRTSDVIKPISRRSPDDPALVLSRCRPCPAGIILGDQLPAASPGKILKHHLAEFAGDRQTQPA